MRRSRPHFLFRLTFVCCLFMSSNFCPLLCFLFYLVVMSEAVVLAIGNSYSFIVGPDAVALLRVSSLLYEAVQRSHHLLLNDDAICLPCEVIYHGGLSGCLRSCPLERTCCYLVFPGDIDDPFMDDEVFTESRSFQLCTRWPYWSCGDCRTIWAARSWARVRTIWDASSECFIRLCTECFASRGSPPYMEDAGSEADE